MGFRLISHDAGVNVMILGAGGIPVNGTAVRVRQANECKRSGLLCALEFGCLM
jgi:hypothetical protein